MFSEKKIVAVLVNFVFLDFSPFTSSKCISFGGTAGDISTFGVEFFEKFDAVIISCCSLGKKVIR